MPQDLRIRHFLEEIHESKRTPEEVCRETPERLPAVRKRLAQIQSLARQLDEMFVGSQGESPIFGDEIERPVISGCQINGFSAITLPK